MAFLQCFAVYSLLATISMAAPVPGNAPRLGDEPQIEEPPLPPAYLPMLSTQSLTAAAPSNAVAGGFFQLTPSKCNSTACTGFRMSNSADFSSSTNTVLLAPCKTEVMIEPVGTGLYEIGTLTVTNGGFRQPTGARMALVPVQAVLTASTPGVNKPTTVTVKFLVMWSLGSPAPPNQAGLLVLVTKNPTPATDFVVAMNGQIDFPMNLQLVGFKADPKQGTHVEVLGDWGQAKPQAGEAGPRVYVKQGASQVIKLYARICNTDNPNNTCKSNLAKSG